jgi:hypothetical protein
MSMVVNTNVYAYVECNCKFASGAHFSVTDLMVQCIHNVETVHEQHQPHTGGNLVQSAESNRLLAQAADVQDPPQDHTGSELIEELDVKAGSARRSRVQGSTHPELYAAVR